MSIDYLEKLTEQVLLSLGVTADEYLPFIIMLIFVMIGYSIGTFLYYKYVICRGLSCSKLKDVINHAGDINSLVRELRTLLRDLHIIDKNEHNTITANIDRVDRSIEIIKSTLSELHGIMYERSVFSGKRRRIDHEDD